MAFDWQDFLDRRAISYEHEGHNIRFACPWCPAPNRRMSVSERGWWCWTKGKEHSGISPNRLVAGLLNCSFEQAAAITGVARKGAIPPPDDFMARIAVLRGEAPIQQIVEEPALEWPKEFRAISTALSPFRSYLNGRGFTDQQINRMTPKYKMQCALNGLWRYRIIFPIYLDQKLVAWTGRTIVKKETKRRYRAEGEAPHYLLWFDELRQKGDCIVLTEGPFDALKVRMLGVPATCFFTSGPSEEQIDLLRDLLPFYRRKVLLLDREAIGATLRAAASIPFTGIETVILKTRKDPGEIATTDELRSIIGIG